MGIFSGMLERQMKLNRQFDRVGEIVTVILLVATVAALVLRGVLWAFGVIGG